MIPSAWVNQKVKRKKASPFSVFFLVLVLLSVLCHHPAQASWKQVGSNVSGDQSYEHSTSSFSIRDDGNVFIVGSNDYDATFNNAGRARVYYFLEGTGWAKLGSDILGQQTNEYCGFSVAISGDGSRISVGCYGYTAPPSSISAAGRARVFALNGGGWIQLGSEIAGDQVNEYAGACVSLSYNGSVVAVGSYGYNGFSSTVAAGGRVRIYSFDGSVWVKLGGDIQGTMTNEYSGRSLSLNADGSIIAIASYTYNSPSFPMAGRVRIFSYLQGSGWMQMGSEIVGEQLVENLGISLALNGDGKRIVIGSSGYDITVSSGALINNAGRVSAYSYNSGSDWTLLGNQIFGTQQSESLGLSVSISKDGNMIAVGCPNCIIPSSAVPMVGRVQVYLYNPSTTRWIQVGDDIQGVQLGEYCGSVVSLSGSGEVLGVGCPYYDASISLPDVGRLSMYVFNAAIPSSSP
eukprot:scaffold2011_cov290-Ochromonas_danica.AAC.1